MSWGCNGSPRLKATKAGERVPTVALFTPSAKAARVLRWMLQ
jgi:hypothetical protein